ncbi:MAG TPA: hypothetical protein VIE86_03920 [Nitrososphaera sp.]|jgi:hypothetical protein
MSTARKLGLSAPELDGKRLLVVMSVIVVTIIIDSEIGYVADFIPAAISSSVGILVFIATGVIFAATQYLVLSYLQQLAGKVKAKALHLNFTQKAVTIAQYVLLAVVAAVILQILLSSQYHTISLYVNLSLSYAIWIVTMAFLGRAFLSWYRSTFADGQKKRIGLVLVFALAMIAYVVNGVSLLTEHVVTLQQHASIITSAYVAFFPEFEPESVVSQLGTLTYISSSVAYVFTWIGTVMLLRRYIPKIGKMRFWAIMGIALVYYLIEFPFYALGFFDPASESDVDVMNNILIFSAMALLAGIVFGAAFLSIARTLRRDSAVREYLVIAAYGMLIFYLAGSATVVQAAYPPFGFVSTAFTGMATFIIYLGLYSSAIAISQDSILRQSIMKSASEQSKLLDNIGTAQMEKEVQTLVSSVSKKAADMAEQSGVEPSMTNDEIRDYMEIVMKELKEKR